MSRQYNEPEFVDAVFGKVDDGGQQVEAEIKELCREQPFAVLATQGQGQPYTNLISFAVSEDLKNMVFSTPSQTRKYSLIVKNKKVSLMIDNRADQPESINLIRAVTVTGTAKPIEEPQELEHWSRLLINRHSYLEKFIKSSSSSLILVDIIRYFYVRRFQEVYQWIPGNRS